MIISKFSCHAKMLDSMKKKETFVSSLFVYLFYTIEKSEKRERENLLLVVIVEYEKKRQRSGDTATQRLV